MKLLKIKAERYQFHYPDGKESGVYGIGKGDDLNIIVDIDNFVMAINNMLYFRVSKDVYISILTDQNTVELLQSLTLYKGV